jgi:hypothetical protein
MYGAPKEFRAQAVRDGDASAKATEIGPYRLTQENSLSAEFTTAPEVRLLRSGRHIAAPQLPDNAMVNRIL